MRAVAVVAAVFMTLAVADAQTVKNAPTCRAERSGEDMITRIVFPDGYTVEGPWHVTGVVSAGTKTTLTAVLDHIIETQPVSSRRELTELPGTIQMTFKGRSMSDVLNEAANLWCATVLKARPPAPRTFNADEHAPANRIM